MFGGCCWFPGKILDLFDDSHLSLWLHVYTLLGTRQGNNTLPKDLWLSSQSPGPNGAATARSKLAPLSPQNSEPCGYFLSFSPSIFLPREVSAASSPALPGPRWTSASFPFSLSTSSLLRRRLPGREAAFCFVTRLLEGLHPSRTDGCLGYF